MTQLEFPPDEPRAPCPDCMEKHGCTFRECKNPVRCLCIGPMCEFCQKRHDRFMAEVKAE